MKENCIEQDMLEDGPTPG